VAPPQQMAQADHLDEPGTKKPGVLIAEPPRNQYAYLSLRGQGRTSQAKKLRPSALGTFAEAAY
jgi:hypothetical protein